MPNQPLNLNLARIVHRLMTSPRGWRVTHLQEELGIAPRTYRKYRQLMQEDFLPFRRRDGTSMIVEVQDGDERYLRLRPPRELGASDPMLDLYTPGVYFAHSLLTQTGVDELRVVADALVADLHASIRDRDFLFKGSLAHANRMFLTDQTLLPHVERLAPLVRAIANHREIELRDGATRSRVAPVSLVLGREALVVVAQNHTGEFVRLQLHELELELLNTSFDYPSLSHYSPRDTD